MYQAVLTGDVINSTGIGDHDKLIKSMKHVLNEVSEQGLIKKDQWAFFGGDSFQVVTGPGEGLKVALILRAAFRGGIYRYFSPLVLDEVLDSVFDVRISIGLGETGEIPGILTEAFGEAFILSGEMLKIISKGDLRLLITTSDKALNEHLEILCILADPYIRGWSEKSSQAVYRKLLLNETQEESAAFFGISQPSMQHRLKIARLDEIEALDRYYRNQAEKDQIE